MDVPSTAVPATLISTKRTLLEVSYQSGPINIRHPQIHLNPIRSDQHAEVNFETLIRNKSQWEQVLCSSWQSAPTQQLLEALYLKDCSIIVAIDGNGSMKIGNYVFVMSIQANTIFRNIDKTFLYFEQSY